MMGNKCLNEEILTSYLEGGLKPPTSTAAEQHLSHCDECRGRLVRYMRILDDDVKEEEDSTVSEVMGRWAKPSPPVRKPHAFLSLKWVGIAACFLLVVTAGIFVTLNRDRVPTPVEIVDLLLSSDRPFEARLSRQPYRPLFVTRGNEALEISRDPLEAELLRRAASNHMMGTFYLLNGEFDTAIQYLEEAANQLPNDVAVQNDLGVAYLERGGSSRDDLAVSLSRARAQFERALDRDPEFTPALYNLTLLFLRLDLRSEATAQQQEYLEVDAESEWAEELRRLLPPN